MREFKLYRNKINTISHGKLYTKEMKVPFSKEKRTIRVWVPDGYNPKDTKTRYPVIYMCDGQNLVDEYTSGYGEWNLDEVESFLSSKGYPHFMIVGVDCPNDPIKRSDELSIPGDFKHYRDMPCEPKGDIYLRFMFDVLKPLIDKNFNTDPKKESTAIGGSSMGGLMAFYGYVKRRDVVGFSLCFSPAFFIYYKNQFMQRLKNWKPNKDEYGKIFFYVGGKDFEHLFTKSTETVYKYLVKNGFDSDKACFVYDATGIHHESYWNEYSYNAFRYWFK